MRGLIWTYSTSDPIWSLNIFYVKRLCTLIKLKVLYIYFCWIVITITFRMHFFNKYFHVIIVFLCFWNQFDNSLQNTVDAVSGFQIFLKLSQSLVDLLDIIHAFESVQFLLNLTQEVINSLHWNISSIQGQSRRDKVPRFLMV